MLALSLALHGTVLLVRGGAPHPPSLPIEFQTTVELGLEEAHPATAPEPAPAPEPPAPEPPPEHPAPRAHARPAPPPPREPPPPEHTPDNLANLVLDADASTSIGDAALAQNDDAATPDDAGALAQNDDAAVAPEPLVPSVASAAPDLARAIPQGSVITLLLRMDRLRRNPQAPRVTNLLGSIRDWRDVLGGTELDPVRDFDTVMFASANPVGDAAHPPDLMAIVRTRAARGFLRASVEQMAGARDPAPLVLDPDAGVPSLRARFEQRDAGPLPPPSRPIWTRRGGAEIATVDRYLGPHSVVLLGNDLAVIASPSRVNALLAVLGGRRGVEAVTSTASPPGSRAARAVALVEARGIRNLVRVPPGARQIVPTRLDLAVYETRDGEGEPDGGAELVSVWQLESAEAATSAAPLVTQYLEGVSDYIDDFSHSTAGAFAAGMGVQFRTLQRALGALHVTPEGATLRVEATLAPEEVAQLLNVQRLATMFR